MITVKTPKGDERKLKAGSTVLEFAEQLHSNILLHAIGARILREGATTPHRVGLLHGLRDGDTVEIEMAMTPQPIRHDIAMRMTARSRRSLRAAYREAASRRGRAYLQRRLIEAGIWPVQDQDALDEIVQDSLAHARARNRLRREIVTIEDFYQELYDYFHGRPVPGRLQPHRIEHMLRLVFERSALPIARAAFGRLAAEVQLMKHCRVCAGTTLVAPLFELRNDGIVCHDQRHPCAEAKAADCYPLPPHNAQYFFIEASDRSGLVADVGDVFEEADVQLDELLARVIGRRTAAIRARVEPSSQETINRVGILLRQVHGVDPEGVFGPEDPISATEALHFDPRQLAREVRKSFPIAPYDVGERIRREERLYGRDDELSDLCRRIEASINFDEPEDGSIFIHGPFKIGKSSLVSTALAVIRRTHSGSLVSTHLDAVRGEPWTQYFERVLDDLWVQAAPLLDAAPGENWRNMLETWGVKDGSRAAALLHLTRTIIDHRVPVVIAIDEVVWLLLKISTDPQASAVCAQALNMLRDQRGVSLVLVGPDLIGLDMDHNVSTVIRTSRKMEVKSLTRDRCVELLLAQKSRLPIEAEDAVQTAVFHETLGRPYWTQLIASEVWNDVVATADGTWHAGAIRYTAEAFSRARDKVSKLVLPFEQQYRPFLDGKQAKLTRAALQLFVDDVRSDKHEGMTLIEIQERLGTVFPNISSEFPRWLQDMEAVGTLVRFHASETWHMAPILARHLDTNGILNGPLS
ncbi:MAG: TGS domain-containing protein [Gemmatimonadaceae bacterium]|nr:TGS domain-containing protein [Gemmatimonadaceae bacterium]